MSSDIHPDGPLDAFNVADPSLYQSDRWQPYFDRLRRDAPVHHCRESLYGPYWSVSTYDLIHQVENRIQSGLSDTDREVLTKLLRSIQESGAAASD